MAQRLAKHGSNAGYKAEQKTGQICERCRRAHNVYNRQYTKAGKAAQLKYASYAVIDHLYQAGTQPEQLRRAEPGRVRAEPETTRTIHSSPEPEPEPETGTDTGGSDLRRSLGQRLSDAVRGVSIAGDEYVSTDDMPDYLRAIDPDPEPADADSSTVNTDEFVITRESMVLIEENMGTYLSVIGMTLEMVDPYCGPILAENFDNIVGRWSKVIARYPSAARLFMSKGGGQIMDWIGAIQATWPFLYAIYEHHLSRTVITDKGRVMRVTQNGQASTVDPTMPPQPEYEYTTH